MDEAGTVDPAEQVAAVAEPATRMATPCGDGVMVWHRWGTGPAVVLLHGGHGSWTHWIRTVPALSARYTVLAADMPGYGESDPPPQPYDAVSLATIIAEGIDHLLLPDEPFSLVGFSFGGVMAGQVARLRGARVRRVVLVGSGGLGLPRPDLAPLTNWRRLTYPAERAAVHLHNLSVLMIRDPVRIDPLALHLQTENTRRARVNSRSISLIDTLRQALAETCAPLAGIWGSEDATALGHLELRRDLLRSLDRDAEFTIVEGAGHWVQYEAPDAFNRALLTILDHPRHRHHGNRPVP